MKNVLKTEISKSANLFFVSALMITCICYTLFPIRYLKFGDNGKIPVSTNIHTINSSSIQSSINYTNYPINILWTRWRSGSSFVGDLLANAHPATFYA